MFFYVEEAEWALEVMKATGKPIAMCLNICSAGDLEGVSVEECAVRIAKAGNSYLKLCQPSFDALLLRCFKPAQRLGLSQVFVSWELY